MIADCSNMTVFVIVSPSLPCAVLSPSWSDLRLPNSCHPLEAEFSFAVASGTFLYCALPELLLPTLQSHGRLDAHTDETYTFDVDSQR